jgi:TRAP-type C4-dicarboxylate transport system permease small subunit
MNELETAPSERGADHALQLLSRGMKMINRATMFVCMVALIAASLILTYSVLTRYFLKISTDWQDEASVFLLVGAVFFASATVQQHRGHVGIEAFAGILPRAVNTVRLFLVDVASLAFCAFFSWKSWTLLHEAVVEGQTTATSWAPPLWIPYGTMALGMSLLCAQIALQLAMRMLGKESLE